MVTATHVRTVRCAHGFHAHCLPEKHGDCACECHAYGSTHYDNVRALLFEERDRCADCGAEVGDGTAYCDDCRDLMSYGHEEEDS